MKSAFGAAVGFALGLGVGVLCAGALQPGPIRTAGEAGPRAGLVQGPGPAAASRAAGTPGEARSVSGLVEAPTAEPPAAEPAAAEPATAEPARRTASAAAGSRRAGGGGARAPGEATGEVEELREELKRARFDAAREASRAVMLESRIKDLVRKSVRDAEVRPDGHVVAHDPRLGVYTLDAGWNDGLARKSRFAVYRRLPGGDRRVVGMLEVEEVQADRAFARSVTIELTDPFSGQTRRVPDPDAPVAVGDLVYNPFFDRRGPRSFVVLGQRVGDGAFSANQVRERIEELGGELQADVDTTTDFVLLLAPDEEDPWVQEQLRMAALLGAACLSDDAALEYLGLAPYPVSELESD